jgi:hypothetical protein
VYCVPVVVNQGEAITHPRGINAASRGLEGLWVSRHDKGSRCDKGLSDIECGGIANVVGVRFER